MSTKARMSRGSVGRPGVGSTTKRTALMVGKPQLPPVAVSIAVSLMPENFLREGIRFEPSAAQQIILKHLARLIGLGIGLYRQVRMGPLGYSFENVLQGAGLFCSRSTQTQVTQSW
jgi:hypothetical protein